MSKIYLASSLGTTKEFMRQCRADLVERGHRVTSTWIDSTNDSDPLANPEACEQAATDCLSEIDRADTLIFFAANVSVGKHVELGYAIAPGKWIYVIGEPTSVFHFARRVQRYPSRAAALEAF